MLKIKDFVGSRFKSPFTRKGKSQRESASSLISKLSVNEEYKEAFRTNSYLEIRTKAEGQLGRTFCDRLSSSSSSSSLSLHIHLTDCLLEPGQETLTSLMEKSNFHCLLIRFFESSLEASNICESILKSIHLTRAYHTKIKRVIKISKRVCKDRTDHCPEKICRLMFLELSRFAALRNPLSVISEAQFRKLHESNVVLLGRLTSKQKRIRRKAKFYRVCKKLGGYGLVISHSALVIALLIIAVHSIVGILAAPPLLACCSVALIKKKIKGKLLKSTDVLERLGTQLDIAAKGIFILINDFDTTSRLVQRLFDEVEHRKTVAAMCVKSQKSDLLMEVVKEFSEHEVRFSEQLQELEEHTYLCFHTINRSRRLVLEHITGSQT